MKTAVDSDVVSLQDAPYSVRLASKYASIAPSRLVEERRQYLRRRDRELDWIRAVRLRSGGDVSLVDLSAGGVLLDAGIPLRPGSVVSLEIVGGGVDAVVPLKVLRCHVVELMADGARYRGAGRFARRIDLPDLPVPSDGPGVPFDPFVGVDSALKRLVERACSVDGSQELAANDVLLVLQSLSRRALTTDGDPFGRQVGTMLQELLPGLRHGHGLPAMLAAIERQLCHELPDVRVRLADGSRPARPGSRSVLIRMPGTITTAESVCIDLPSTTVVNDTQARLLRTSSRLIALVQRLNASSSSSLSVTTSRISEADAPAANAAWQKVVVRYTDGQMLKGFTHDFHGSKMQFSLWPSTTAAGHERVVVPLARLKAVFFVREFNGNPDHIEQKMFEQPAHGRRIEVTLIDNEVLVGTTLNYRTDSAGFFISPADPRANNVRIFVVSSAVRQVRFP